MPRLMKRLSGWFARNQTTPSAAPESSNINRSKRPASDPSSVRSNTAPRKSAAPQQPPKNQVDQAARLREVAKADPPKQPASQTTDSTNARTDCIVSPSKPSQPEVITRTYTVRSFFSPSRKREKRKIEARNYEQVLNLIERIGNHLDTQAQRSDRMVSLLERLPNALEALPDIRKNSEKLTSAIENHFDAQKQRDGQLREAIEELGAGADRQNQALTLIQNEIQAGQQREAELATVLTDFRTTLKNMGETNERSVEVLKNLAVRSHQQETRFASILQRQNKTLMIVASAVVISSIAGLVVAILAILRITAI